jgi:ribosome assembly protein 1
LDISDLEKVEKISSALKLKLPAHELKRAVRTPVTLASTLLAQWLPLSTTVLLAVIQNTPSPVVGQQKRLPFVFPFLRNHALGHYLYECSSDENAPTIAFVSKMVALPASSFPKRGKRIATVEELIARKEALAHAKAEGLNQDMESISIVNGSSKSTDEEQDIPEGEVMVGMGRLYSGKLAQGDTIYVFGPKYDPRHPTEHVTAVTAEQLFVFMGRDVENVQVVCPGTIFGICGKDFESAVLKSATVSSTLDFPSLASLETQIAPIVRVAVEPKNPNDMQKLIDGLKLLNQSDPAVEVIVQPSGEHVILTAGELHLEVTP